MPKKPTPPPNFTEQIAAIPLPLDSITIGDQQLRTHQDDDAITELALDIETRGLLQPIGVTEAGPGRFQLLYGSRRLAAYRYLKRSTIPAIIRPPGDTLKAVAIAENIHRAQLTLEEETDAVVYLATGPEPRSTSQIAALLCKSVAWVQRRLSIPQLPPVLRAPLLAGSLSLGAAEELAKIDDSELLGWLASEAARSNLSVAQIRATVELAAQNEEIQRQVAPAVASGAAAAAAPSIYLACESCHTPRQPHQLAIVRVCRDGCATKSEADDTPPH